MARGRYADSLRIPCYSMLRMQGDSVRMILPSKVALFSPRVEAPPLSRSVAALVFTAQKSADGEKALLEWNSNIPTDDAHFIIERSADGGIYERLGTVDANSNLQNYTFEDGLPFEEDNLYRLVLKKADGKEIVTEPQWLNFPVVKGFELYPNPATTELTLHLKQFSKASIDIVLYDAIGKQLYKEHIDNNTALKKTLNLSSLNLTEGYYNLVVLHKGRAFSRRFVVAK
jgi:hypothetical protein